MNIGIIVHSHTGNTLSVAQKLRERFLADGHSVALEQVTAVNDSQSNAGKVQLSSVPDISSYDKVVFGAPVRGFSLSPVMTAYLSKVISLREKKVACFVTQAFPYPWMGGNRAISQMKNACESKGAEVFETGVVNWSNRRNQKIADTVERFSRA